MHKLFCGLQLSKVFYRSFQHLAILVVFLLQSGVPDYTMKYLEGLLSTVCLLATCDASIKNRLKNPAKRSDIVVPDILNNVLAKSSSQILREYVESSAKLAGVSSQDEDAQYPAMLESLSKQHASVPKTNTRKNISQYKEAFVDVVDCNDQWHADCKVRVSGTFGLHSPYKTVRGRLLHVRDKDRADSHFGCTKEIGNALDIQHSAEPWIALIARGKCSFVIKIKLAQRYNASAVIIYDEDGQTGITFMQTIGEFFNIVIRCNVQVSYAFIVTRKGVAKVASGAGSSRNLIVSLRLYNIYK